VLDSHWLTTFQSLHNKRVLSIDLSAIMAGSGIRGQFEEKFKGLIRDIEDEAGLFDYSPPMNR
jgi:ATP-dependent Clp protease ATP-binding subunit ClpA